MQNNLRGRFAPFRCWRIGAGRCRPRGGVRRCLARRQAALSAPRHQLPKAMRLANKERPPRTVSSLKRTPLR